jgi:carbon monoxide dehydrogenase subunit G
MELTDQFDVGVPVETAWAVLTDLERIAPCMPGAQLTEVEGDEYRGTVKVKVGPITAQYKGVARFAEKDDGAHRAVIDAQGRDTRGQGNANATITASLEPNGDGTRVSITTDLKLTGKVAQFGRGAIQDVSGALLGQFVSCLEHDLLAAPEEVEAEAEDQDEGVPVPPAEPAPVAADDAVDPLADVPPPEPAPGGVRTIDGPEAEAVDLLAVAGGTFAKYAIGAVVVVAVTVLLLVLLLS